MKTIFDNLIMSYSITIAVIFTPVLIDRMDGSQASHAFWGLVSVITFLITVLGIWYDDRAQKKLVAKLRADLEE